MSACASATVASAATEYGKGVITDLMRGMRRMRAGGLLASHAAARGVLQPPGGRGTASHGLEEARQVVGVLFLHLQDVLDQPPRGRIVVAEPADDLGVGLDGDPLGHQV